MLIKEQSSLNKILLKYSTVIVPLKYNYKTAFRTNLSSNSEGSIMDHQVKYRVFKKDDTPRGLRKNITGGLHFWNN